MVKNISSIANKNGFITSAMIPGIKLPIEDFKEGLNTSPTYKQLFGLYALFCEGLSPFVSSIVFNRIHGIEETQHRAEGCGLILSYELSGALNLETYLKENERVLIPGNTIKIAREQDVDAIKLQIPYDTTASQEKIRVLQKFVELIGAECYVCNMPFVLDITFPSESGKLRPYLVKDSMQEFSDPKYKADCLMVRLPFKPEYTKGTRTYTLKNSSMKDSAYDYVLEDLPKIIDNQNKSANGLPFVIYTPYIPDGNFIDGLELLINNGSQLSGIAARGIWRDPIRIYLKEGYDAALEWITTKGVENFKRLERILTRGAVPWYQRPAVIKDRQQLSNNSEDPQLTLNLQTKN